MDARFDARAWVAWVLAAAVVAMVARNPLYTIIVLLASQVVAATCATIDGWDLPLWRIGAVVVLLSTLFNALFVPVGATVLFRLPAGWPLVGGPVTLEAAVYGAETGLILLALLAIFLAFNRIVPVSELVRLTPRAFHDLGVVVLIAITYVPETARHLQRIREAQAVRGHRLQGVRDWQPIVIPLLIGGLERAMNLAEAMVARGYGATAGRRQSTPVLAGIALGLLLVFGGWVLALWQGWPGWVLLASGIVVLALLIWRSGREVVYTRYRPRPWRNTDSVLLLVALLPLLLIALPWPFVDRATLTFSPYPQVGLPSFDPILGIVFALFAIPAIVTATVQPPPERDR